MIAWLYGKIVDKQEAGRIVLSVNGVGYDVETSLQTFSQLETQSNELGLYIQTIVREDAILLYGFISKVERSLFRALIKVNGIGPKVAMSILSATTPKDFQRVIQQKNSLMLSKLPGIGKKTAERLIIELYDKLDQLEESDLFILDEAASSPMNSQRDEAIQALEALGYRWHDAVKVIKQLDDGSKSCEQLIRQGLQILSTH